MKHGEGKELARQMYMYEQCTFDEIARHIGRSDKTIRDWAEKDGWKRQREEILQNKFKLHDRLYLIVDKLTSRLLDDTDSGKEIDKELVNRIEKLVATMQRSQKYDGTVKKEVDASKPKKKRVYLKRLSQN